VRREQAGEFVLHAQTSFQGTFETGFTFIERFERRKVRFVEIFLR